MKYLKLLGICFFSLLSIVVAAQIKGDSLLKSLNSSALDTARVKTLIELHKFYRFNPDSSLYYVRQAIEVSERIKDNNFIARSHVALAWHYNSTTKNQDSALIIARSTLESMQRANYVDGMARACNMISVVYAETQLDSAVFYSLKTIDLHKKNNNLNGVNSAKINLGGMYNNMKKYKEAIALVTEVVPYFDSIKNYHYAGTACINLGNYYLNLNDFANAIIYMQKSYDYNKLRSDVYGEAYALAQIGHIYLKQNKFNEALPFFTQAVARGKEINSEEIKFMGYGGLIQIAAANNEWGKVISFDNEELKKAFMHEPDEAKIYELLATGYEKQGNYEKALLNHKQYVLLNNKIDNKERMQKADELEAQYQNKEKQNRIELLSKEKKIEAAEKQKQLLMRNVAIALALILLFVACLLFNRFKLKKKIEQQQALLTERKRISAELHDDLGAQLSTTRMLIGKLKPGLQASDDPMVIEKSINMLEDSIYKLRGMMNDLENTTLEKEGYLKATEELINEIKGIQNINFELSHSNLNERLDKNVEHHLFRITQELINNTLKFAQAGNVLITIVRDNDRINFMYEDDGKGFDVESVKKGKGLNNIIQRANAINAITETDSKPGKGMRLNLLFRV